MNRIFVSTGPVLMLVLVLCSTLTIAAEKVTLTGRVQIHAINEDDTVTAISIETDDEAYLVIDNATGRRLYKTPGADIKVTGIVDTNAEGQKTLSITSYEIVDETLSGETEGIQ